MEENKEEMLQEPEPMERPEEPEQTGETQETIEEEMQGTIEEETQEPTEGEQQEPEGQAVSDSPEQEEVPVQSAFAGAEIYEETPDWDTLIGKDLTETSQQRSWRRTLQKSIIGVLAVAVVLLAALLMMKSGTAKKAAFLDRHIALITPGTGYYHTYDCDQFDPSSFISYNIKTAEKKGYLPCPECHEK
ncbi:MAG: hypothetical protein SO147_00475 [Clostridia bacterium]|nr:hypothetical protein [Clostridia bacterium]